MNSVWSSGLSSLSVPTLRELVTPKKNLMQQKTLSPDNRMSSPAVVEERNQGRIGKWLFLLQVVEGEGSPLG